MHLFYQSDLSGDSIQLSEEESKHAVRVLRMAIGEQVAIVDGKGTRAISEVANDHPKRCELRILSRTQEKSPRNFHLHIAIAPTKNLERIEWFVEKAVEIGVDEISFVECEHSERNVLKLDRIEKVAVSAMKQSKQSWLPVINEMVSFNKFVTSKGADIKLIAHCDEGSKNPISSFSFPEKSVLVLIGPEGDFSRAEIESAIQNQFTSVSLGDTRLRTETAALYAVTAVNIKA